MKVAGSTTDDSEPLNLAIEVVGSSGQAHLARQLIEFLMGETDGIPKDAKVIKDEKYFKMLRRKCCSGSTDPYHNNTDQVPDPDLVKVQVLVGR